MDAFYVFQHSPFGDEELRYSLRSLRKHFRGLGKVWIFGDRPAFLSDEKSIVEHVPQSAIARIGDFAMPVTNLFRQIFLSSLIPELDADIDFHPDAVDRVRSHNLPIVCGIYPQKGKRAIACHILPGTPQIVFGQGGGLVEVRYCATGFMHVRRVVYERIQQRLALPICNERFGEPMIPFFQPMLHECDDGHWYLAEDYAFCQRARECGFAIVADSTIRLWHVGTYAFGWEDAGLERQRHARFTLHFPDSAPGERGVT